jgi:ABC-2 type transport system ATP-binding protein
MAKKSIKQSLISNFSFFCSQIVLKKILKDFRAKTKSTIIISSHDLNHITELCSRIIILENGNTMQDLQNDITTLNILQKYFSLD